jgi:hypothetical protein
MPKHVRTSKGERACRSILLRHSVGALANPSRNVLVFSGNNFACFSFQLLEQGIPDFATKALNALDPVTSLINRYLGPVVGGLSCPQLGQFDDGVFDRFPGRAYSPTGPATNYKK